MVEATRRYEYMIVARRGALDLGAADLLNREGVEKWLVVIDATVERLYGDRLREFLGGLDGDVHTLILETAESKKERAAVDRILRAALEADLYRRDEIIAIGGGVLLDLVGVAAAELRKETPYSVIPTTLVGDVDAALGSKRAINYRYRARNGAGEIVKKSFIGDYHPARIAVIDPDFLATLPKQELRAGLAEIKKVAEMTSAELFAHLEQHGGDLIEMRFRGAVGDTTLWLAITGILRQLANDLWESELKRWPDHGHSISPTLEIETGMPHGLTVNICASLGAAVANGREANGHKILSDPAFQRMLGLSAALGLPVWHPSLSDHNFLMRAVNATARARGGYHWPVPSGIGEHVFVQPSLSELEAASNALREHANPIP